jgi:hypothetical protein
VSPASKSLILPLFQGKPNFAGPHARDGAHDLAIVIKALIKILPTIFFRLPQEQAPESLSVVRAFNSGDTPVAHRGKSLPSLSCYGHAAR